MDRQFCIAVAATFTLTVPLAAAAGWSRTYGYGSQSQLAGVNEVTFIDDTTMPIKSLTKISLFVENQSGATHYLRYHCCKRAKLGAKTPAWSCDALADGPTGLGPKQVDITALSTCKDTAANFTYLHLTTNATGDAVKFFVGGVVTEGS